MHLGFDQPWNLLAALLSVPLVWMAVKSFAAEGPWRTVVGVAIRLMLLAALTMALAQPSLSHHGSAVAVLVVADQSASMPADALPRVERQIAESLKDVSPQDVRLGVVAVGAAPAVAALARENTALPSLTYPVDRGASDLAAGVRLALAAKPSDASARVLLVSDGNENAGDVLAAADQARALGVPVDVLPIRYRHEREVLVEGLRAPTQVREGQGVELQATVRCQQEGDVRVRLWHNDEPISLDPDDPSGALTVSLDPGPNALRIPAPVGGSGAHRYRLEVEPVEPAADHVAENNIGTTTLVVGGQGRVLLVEGAVGGDGSAMAQALQQAGVDVQRMDAERACMLEAADLAMYDALIVANVPRWVVTNQFDRMLRTYVHDLGGGLLMTGGPEGLGAGGWLGSEVAHALPVRLDPPQTRQLLKSALAIVIDRSGSMTSPVGLGSATKLDVAGEGAVAAIRALSRLDEVAIVAFHGATEVILPLTRVGDGRFVELLVRDLGSGGGTVMAPALEAARLELRGSRAGTRHIVVLTDGESADSAEELSQQVRAIASDGITLSTIAIGGDANLQVLRALASKGGGRAYEVAVDRAGIEVPQIFVREASMKGRALIVEDDVVPSVLLPRGGPLDGIGVVPAIRGYVLCVPRDGLAQVGAAVQSKEGVDPIAAWWNHGTGRAMVVTTDLASRWCDPWLASGALARVTEQSVRWLMRPAAMTGVRVAFQADGDEADLIVDFDEGAQAAAMGHDSRALVVRPDGEVVAVPLRQTAAGRLVGRMRTDAQGSYLAAVTCVGVGANGQPQAGTVHAVHSLAYPAEYRSVQDNAALLRAVAERTGGRVLDPALPATWDLASKAGLAPSVTATPLWDVLAIIAAVLLLLDVAWRRLSLSRDDARVLAASAGLTRVPTGDTAPRIEGPSRADAEPSPPRRTLDLLRTARDRAARTHKPQHED